MLSLTSPKPLSISSPSLHLPHKRPSCTITCSYSSNYSSSQSPQTNLILPNSNSSSSSAASPQPLNLYQPYRPPPSPLLTKYNNVDTATAIDILSNRLGRWFEYAPLIATLFRDGFNPPSIEELTGISGVDQNRLVVAAQVRQTIADSPNLDPDTLAYFDTGGSEILYELRLLSTSQRAAAANYIVANKYDGAKARDIARSIKEFPARQEEAGWCCFDYACPGDCWAWTYLRLSREFVNNVEKKRSVLGTALEVAQTDKAKERVMEEMEGKAEEEGGKADEAVRVPVVRLKIGEVAEATTVVVLPVSEGEEGEDGIGRVPRECRSEGDFGFVVADKGWDRWVVLPRWVPLAGIGGGGVAVAFSDARSLPWKVNRTYLEEPILVVVDRNRRAVEFEDGFYLASVAVGGAEGGLKVERGSTLKESGLSESLGTVVIVVRPPTDEVADQLRDEDWD